MIDKEIVELARKHPETARQIISLFRWQVDREQAEKILKANGVVLDYSGHNPQDLEL